VTDVEAFVALQADQVGVERCGNCGGQRCLADSGFALEEQWPSETESQKQGDGQALVGDIALLAQSCTQIGQ
jgi:hypothetical protein